MESWNLCPSTISTVTLNKYHSQQYKLKAIYFTNTQANYVYQLLLILLELLIVLELTDYDNNSMEPVLLSIKTSPIEMRLLKDSHMNSLLPLSQYGCLVTVTTLARFEQ